MDASDVRCTLEPGGLSSIAFASAETTERRGLIGRFRDDGHSVDTAEKVGGLVRRAVQSRRTLAADSGTVADRDLRPTRGVLPKGSRECPSVARAGDRQHRGPGRGHPMPVAEELTAAVLLSNVTQVDRIEELQEIAVTVREDVRRKRVGRQKRIDQVLSKEELEPVQRHAPAGERWTSCRPRVRRSGEPAHRPGPRRSLRPMTDCLRCAPRPRPVRRAPRGTPGRSR